MATRGKKTSKSRAKTQTQSQTLNQDLTAQQVLAQTVLDKVTTQQDRIKELETKLKQKDEETAVKVKELEEKAAAAAASANSQVVSETATVSQKEILDYLENEILPRANGSFSGAVPVMKDGKFEVRRVGTKKELEDLIAEIKNGTAQMAAASLPTTNLPSGGFLNKIKKLIGG